MAKRFIASKPKEEDRFPKPLKTPLNVWKKPLQTPKMEKVKTNDPPHN